MGSGDVKDEDRDKGCPRHSCAGGEEGFLALWPVELCFALADGRLWIQARGWAEILGNENLARVQRPQE